MCSQEDTKMVQRYPGLIVKGRTFFFRVAVPRKYWTIARCKEIGYSLNTSDYKQAVARWRTEIAHLQSFLNVFEDIIMKINDNKKLTLDENDVDKILLYRLGQIQHFIEENANEIEKGEKTVKDIQLYSSKDKKKKSDKIETLMSNLIIDYLKKLVDSNQANITLRSVYSKLRDKEIELGLAETNSNGDVWFKSFSTHIHSLEKYASYSVKAIKDNKPYNPSNPKVKTLLQTYDTIKTNERINRSMTSTSWSKLYKRFSVMKENRSGVSKERLKKARQYIRLAFILMKREYVEDITKQDCRKLSELIYKVPKRWMDKIEKDEDVFKILTDSPKKRLSKMTVHYYLTTFKEFMRYAEKEEIIPNSLNLFVDSPAKIVKNPREPFTYDELKKIFNPKTYIEPYERKNAAKFWVPIIALYQGCRLNEICQMDLDDVVLNKKIPCFSINHNGNGKSTKNESSVRTIPIHPKLLEMGFLSYVEYQRKRGKKKLFSELKKIENGMFGRPVQSWFSRYLDRIGIREKSKVFHSFRHTFETEAVDSKIPTEYQNALGGWVDYGIGQRIYGRRKDIRIMLEEISKISYPIHKELKGLEKMFRDSYVFRW